jgi:hypothetical protein
MSQCQALSPCVNSEDFNPSINIYFSSPLPSDYRKAFGEHLLQEGFASKLVKEKTLSSE